MTLFSEVFILWEEDPVELSGIWVKAADLYEWSIMFFFYLIVFLSTVGGLAY